MASRKASGKGSRHGDTAFIMALVFHGDDSQNLDYLLWEKFGINPGSVPREQLADQVREILSHAIAAEAQAVAGVSRFTAN